MQEAHLLPSGEAGPAGQGGGAAGQEGADPVHNFVTALADLSYPKAALTQLQDAPYMLALEDGIRAALEEQPGDHVAAFTLLLEVTRYLNQSQM